MATSKAALSDTNRDDEPAYGLVNGLLIAIPVWVLFGIGLVALVENGPIGETISLGIMIAAISEAILLRHALRGPMALSGNILRSSLARGVHAMRPLFRQTMALSALAAGYLQYYFLEVNLQIAALNSVIVFVPVPS